ncbi:hypothetical protein [Desulfosporosinus youngiae]|uniref:Uncharacterized protein n=1 Tax=Desulfosporosinus youngiae DSM 17734 TaxID=768710 RepID=H5Y2K2_9FIRM|nr:hypothetical protein [Desulfosporosinus youngiae]EHQ88693.1 hypothetical protein DesyoDRAFT_1554 [Desulfosporosinus youngiae DSM 17734]
MDFNKFPNISPESFMLIGAEISQAYYQKGRKDGNIEGYTKAAMDFKPAISDGTRKGSSLCASKLNMYKFFKKHGISFPED